MYAHFLQYEAHAAVGGTPTAHFFTRLRFRQVGVCYSEAAANFLWYEVAVLNMELSISLLGYCAEPEDTRFDPANVDKAALNIGVVISSIGLTSV